MTKTNNQSHHFLNTFCIFLWAILKIVRTHFVPTAVADEGLAKNSACPPEALGEGGNRNPERRLPRIITK